MIHRPRSDERPFGAHIRGYLRAALVPKSGGWPAVQDQAVAVQPVVVGWAVLAGDGRLTMDLPPGAKRRDPAGSAPPTELHTIMRNK